MLKKYPNHTKKGNAQQTEEGQTEEQKEEKKIRYENLI
jgi:hypothetical protein